MRVAIIDIGSNTANLAVYDHDGAGLLTPLAERATPFGLLRQLGSDGTLPSATIAATLALLRGFVRKAANLKVERVEVIATSALRDAPNREALIGRAEREFGVRIRVLDGPEEGRCAAIAALHSLPVHDGFVVDMGGGSLQIAEVRERRFVRAASLPLGALRLALHYGGPDPLDPARVTALRREVRSRLAEVPWFTHGDGVLVGLGGTIRSLARMDRRTRDWPVPHVHGYSLDEDGIESIWETVSRVPSSGLRDIPGLPAHRVGLIVPGALVVCWLLRVGGFSEMRICDDGVREGTLLDADPPAVDVVRDHALRRAFPLDADAQVARDAVLAVYDALAADRAPGWRPAFALAATVALSGLDPDSLLETPLAGYWQDDLLAADALLRPAAPSPLDPALRERAQVLLTLARTLPVLPVRISVDGIRMHTLLPMQEGVASNFRTLFERDLIYETVASVTA